MTVQTSPFFADHEQVVFFSDSATGLRAIIAIHSTVLGPAAGGCRMWNYADEQSAIDDVLRLSRGMSYKNAMADLPLGGGKAVILGDPRRHKSEALLEAFGRAVDSLAGRYVTAEDVGITVADMTVAARRTRYISGLGKTGASVGGDPSPKTAQGVFVGLQAAVAARLDRSDLEGLGVAVQGLGNVGYHLCRNLHQAGARLVVADVDEGRVARVCDEFGATGVSVDEILFADVDVLAPCALGGVLNARTIPQIRASVVAGAANNQLAEDADGARLQARGILYAPDYVINAGGIISVAAEYLGGKSESDVERDITRIHDRLVDLFARAKSEGKPTNVVADAMAEERMRRAADRAGRVRAA
ncbi:MAG: Glu/Leu/Phe/Val dehydrogenase [Alphaproteobacteria bacterium]|nr:MAG: Glu/Leu/Phe/Val dehydrogenase [Alphaproteobacteria bacterium]